MASLPHTPSILEVESLMSIDADVNERLIVTQFGHKAPAFEYVHLVSKVTTELRCLPPENRGISSRLPVQCAKRPQLADGCILKLMIEYHVPVAGNGMQPASYWNYCCERRECREISPKTKGLRKLN